MSKTVLITGASRGIGAGIAAAFARAGYNVAVNCRSMQGGRTSVETCRALGAEAECFSGDISDFDAAGEVVTAAKNRFGSLDVLINNAGITKDGLIARMSEHDFDEVIRVNLKSVFNMIRHVTPVMMKQRKGSIVNMSSVAGVYGNKSQINYAASKAGIIGITKSTAKELGSRGITCNAIAPGFIQTEMTDGMPEQYRQAIVASTLMGRFGTPEDIAEAALFLAGHDFITGQVLVVDGGLKM